MKPNPHPGPSNLGGKKLFYEKFYFGRKLQGEKGGKFSGNTAGLSYTVSVAFGRGGIAIVRLRFATGSPSNWGSHAPQSWVKFWTLFKCPQKIQGAVGESFPLEGILSLKVRRG